MGIDAVLSAAEKVIAKTVPSSIEITGVDFEGPVFVIYTKTLDEFSKHGEVVKNLAQALRRRVVIRPDQSLMEDEASAEKIINKIVPKEAKITTIFFDPAIGEVTIEALSPGLVIGKQGSQLNEIKKQTGWVPRVVRTPPIPSKTIEEIRNYLRSVKEERREFLKSIGRRLNRESLPGEPWVRITALGGFGQVGRSCALLSTNNSRILIDCGLDVSSNDNPTPFLNVPEVKPLDSIDAIVVTHAHLDHSGIVPALYKYGYDGPVYCTLPTRDLMALLQLDGIKVSYGENRKAPYESEHIREAVKHCIPLGYGETTDVAPDIRLTFHNAGHILGSAVCHFHIGEGLYNVAFTGDIKFEKTGLFNRAMNKFPRVETLVMEATYGGFRDIQPSRHEAQDQIREIMGRTLNKGGKVLIPVFAVGRSQEVMLSVEELMRTEEIPTAPVYLDGMIFEATAIHTTYPEFLNSHLRTKIFQKGENPFLSDIFNRVDSREMREKLLQSEDSCVVLATSGMMNGGPILSYFRAWADDKCNSLVFVGYQAEGTLGRKLQRGWDEVMFTEMGKPINIKVNLDIETCDGFSGHSDRKQLVHYVRTMDPKPERVLVNHGEEAKCMDLASSLYKKFNIETRSPKNLETVRIK